VQGELLALRYLPSGSEVVMRAGAGEFFAQSAMGLSHYDCDAKAKSTTHAVREGSMADKGLRLASLSEELGLDVATLSRAISKLQTAGEVVGKGRHVKLASNVATQETSRI
jgi:hypothetical protein